jgi:hypothetical protein
MLMKFRTIAVAAVVAVCMSACASPSPENLLTKDQVESLLVHKNETLFKGAIGGDAVANQITSPASARTYRTEAKSKSGPLAIQPAKCESGVVPLSLPSDSSSNDILYIGPALVLVAGPNSGAQLRQMARFFTNIDSAKKFMSDYRSALQSCSEFTVASDAGPLKVKQSVQDANLADGAFTLDVETIQAGKSSGTSRSFFIRSGNAVIDLAIPGGLGDAGHLGDEAAKAMAARMSGKINASGSANQTIKEACPTLAAATSFSTQDTIDAGYAGKYQQFDEWAGQVRTALQSVRNAEVQKAGRDLLSKLSAARDAVKVYADAGNGSGGSKMEAAVTEVQPVTC